MIGDGPLRARAQAMLAEAGVAGLAWLPGQRDDIPEILRGLDCFVLPSLAEGISNTILEAMASGLPVIATDVGGNAELIEAGRSGELVAVSDAAAMAQQIARYANDPQQARAAGAGGAGQGRAALQPASDERALPGSLRSTAERECRQHGRPQGFDSPLGDGRKKRQGN
jgi:glycosyltransferase involved in cell wall biosynthesis